MNHKMLNKSFTNLLRPVTKQTKERYGWQTKQKNNINNIK